MSSVMLEVQICRTVPPLAFLGEPGDEGLPGHENQGRAASYDGHASHLRFPIKHTAAREKNHLFAANGTH